MALNLELKIPKKRITTKKKKKTDRNVANIENKLTEY